VCASIIPNERNGDRTDTFIPVTRDAMADQVAISTPENAFLPIAVWLEVSLQCSGFAGARPEWDKFRQGSRNLLGAKAPTLQIGEKPPKMLPGGKAPKTSFRWRSA
jgi:hypothetical protein